MFVRTQYEVNWNLVFKCCFFVPEMPLPKEPQNGNVPVETSLSDSSRPRFYVQRLPVSVSPQQRSTVASMMHRQETVECLKKFNARRKLKVWNCTRDVKLSFTSSVTTSPSNDRSSGRIKTACHLLSFSNTARFSLDPSFSPLLDG